MKLRWPAQDRSQWWKLVCAYASWELGAGESGAHIVGRSPNSDTIDDDSKLP